MLLLVLPRRNPTHSAISRNHTESHAAILNDTPPTHMLTQPQLGRAAAECLHGVAREPENNQHMLSEGRGIEGGKAQMRATLPPW